MKVKKKHIMCVLFVVGICLVGWKVKPVELIDSKRLIDLDQMIVEADYGKEGNTDTDNDGADKDVDADKDEDGNIPEEEQSGKIKMTVSVRGEKIFFEGKQIASTNVLKSFLIRDCNADVLLYLEDDYAEAHAYKAVYEAMEQVREQKGFRISEVVR